MHVYYYDENFKYQGEDVIDFDELPENATDVRPEGYIFPCMMRTRKSGLNQQHKNTLIACSQSPSRQKWRSCKRK